MSTKLTNGSTVPRTFSGAAEKSRWTAPPQRQHSFIQLLVGLGIHINIAQSIWLNYLLPFDRWMVWCASKYETDSDFLYSLKTLKKRAPKKSLQFINRLGYYGYFQLITWMANQHYALSPDLPTYAAKGNHLEICKWLATKKDVNFLEVPSIAAMRDNLAMFKLAWKIVSRDNNYMYEYVNDSHKSNIWKNCVRFGSLTILKWLHKKEECLCAFDIDVSAAFHGHLEILQWLVSEHPERPIKLSARTMSFAAQGKHWHILKWLHHVGCPWSDNVCSEIASAGNLEILKWARNNGCPWTSRTTTLAAVYGHLEILRWAYENGCPISFECWNLALRKGHLPILQWMKETVPKYTKWDESCCSDAALFEHLDILMWLRSGDNPCPWDNYVYNRAVNSNCIAIIEYAYQNGCPGIETICSIAKTYGFARSHIIEWMHTNGVPCEC